MTNKLSKYRNLNVLIDIYYIHIPMQTIHVFRIELAHLHCNFSYYTIYWYCFNTDVLGSLFYITVLL